MKNKLFLLLSVALIFAAAVSCTDSLMPPRTENAGLEITIGAASDGSKATYSPVFQDPPLSTFAKIILEIAKTSTPDVPVATFDSTGNGTMAGGIWTIKLPDLVYGAYTITARAYMSGVDSATHPEEYAAIGEKAITLSQSTPRASLTMKPVVSEGTGTLKYTLTDLDTIPAAAKLYKFNAITIKGDLFQTLTVNGTLQTINNIPAGYYVLEFGDNFPSAVHIYQNLVTELSETNEIFNLSKDYVEGVDITLSREGKIRGGTLITITVSGQYVPGSLRLNGETDTDLLSPELAPVGGTYTRTFTMPTRSIVVSASRIPPEIEIDFAYLNKHENLGFWSVTPSAFISSAKPGQTITIKAYEEKTNSSSPEIPLVITSWFLNGDDQHVATPTFTVPSTCTADDYVGVMITIDDALHSVAIPIVLP